MQRAGDRGGGRNQPDFARSFCPVAPDFIGKLNQDYVDRWGVLGPYNSQVSKEQRVGSAAGREEFFGKRISESHMHSALDLAHACFRVDCMTDVVSRDYALNAAIRSEEHTSELQSLRHLVC